MKKIAIVFWSGTGNTEIMAREIEQGARDGGAEVTVMTAAGFTAQQVGNFDAIAFGCPSMGMEVLEENEFEPMFASVESSLSGKAIALFGSYGWGDGQWMRDWQARCVSAGATILGGEGLILNETPDEAGRQQCRALGAALAS